MTQRIGHLAHFAALTLLFALVPPAFAEDGQASSFGEMKYKALDPIQLGKEAKPLYQVDAYFRLKDLREISARDPGAYIIPSMADQDPTGLGKEANPSIRLTPTSRLRTLGRSPPGIGGLTSCLRR